MKTDSDFALLRVPKSAHLIGQEGSRYQIPTPALVLDLDKLEDNLAYMALHCQKHGLGLRPHAKTHKSANIAKLQLTAGAVGICCAKLAEAEALAAQGVPKLFLTSPAVTPGSIARAVALTQQVEELILTVDSQKIACDIQQAAAAAGVVMHLAIDLDVGLHRTGIAPGDGASAMAHYIDSASHLVFRGLQAYAGHLMHVGDFADRKAKSLDAMRQLGEMRDRLQAEGIACEILTGGGTGTFNIDPEAGVLTDLQGGSYVFMDREYNEVPIANNAPIPFETALFVQTHGDQHQHARLGDHRCGAEIFLHRCGSADHSWRRAGRGKLFFLWRRTGRRSVSGKIATDRVRNRHCVRGAAL